MSREPDYSGLSPEEQRIVKRAWQRLWRTIHGALVNMIHCHGVINTGSLPSAMKRIRGQGKDPVDEFLRSIIEMREYEETSDRTEVHSELSTGESDLSVQDKVGTDKGTPILSEGTDS